MGQAPSGELNEKSAGDAARNRRPVLGECSPREKWPASRERVGGEQVNLPFAKVQRGFDGFEHPGLLRGFEREAILRHEQLAGLREGFGVGEEVVDLVDGVGREDADIALVFEICQDLGPGEVGGLRDLEGDDAGCDRGARRQFFPK